MAASVPWKEETETKNDTSQFKYYWYVVNMRYKNNTFYLKIVCRNKSNNKIQPSYELSLASNPETFTNHEIETSTKVTNENETIGFSINITKLDNGKNRLNILQYEGTTIKNVYFNDDIISHISDNNYTDKLNFLVDINKQNALGISIIHIPSIVGGSKSLMSFISGGTPPSTTKFITYGYELFDTDNIPGDKPVNKQGDKTGLPQDDTTGNKTSNTSDKNVFPYKTLKFTKNSNITKELLQSNLRSDSITTEQKMLFVLQYAHKNARKESIEKVPFGKYLILSIFNQNSNTTEATASNIISKLDKNCKNRTLTDNCMDNIIVQLKKHKIKMS